MFEKGRCAVKGISVSAVRCYSPLAVLWTARHRGEDPQVSRDRCYVFECRVDKSYYLTHNVGR